ncbi:MAG: hypothetical protein HS113_27700 [Verrucomicrobiales bacterium]|nr:hypothetical protein [Verrucomicrobiales bacterium]
MQRVLIEFVDFPGLEREQNPFLPMLRQRFDLVESEYPDYVVFTHEGQRHRLYPCTKIYYTQERYLPDWRACDYAILSIQLDDPRAFHLPYYSLWRDPRPLLRTGTEDWAAELARKRGFCSFLVGYDDRSVHVRSRFFHQLDARKRVDSAGRGLNNVGWQVPPGVPPKLEFLSRYKFHLAFENAAVRGYTTEKITDAFAARTVPIYWGDETVTAQFNPDAFIHRRDFDSDEACIEHILAVDADDARYLRYLSAPPFRDNRPNAEWDHTRLLDFFDRILATPPRPVAQRRWFFGLTRWRLLKRVKTHAEKGMETSEERFRQRTQAAGPPPC